MLETAKKNVEMTARATGRTHVADYLPQVTPLALPTYIPPLVVTHIYTPLEPVFMYVLPHILGPYPIPYYITAISYIGLPTCIPPLALAHVCNC